MTCRRCRRSRMRVVEHAPSLPLSYARCDTCGYITVFAQQPVRNELGRLMRLARTHVSPRVRSWLFAGLWVALSVWVVWADYLGAFEIPFPITYLLPVVFAANSGYRVIAIALSFALPFARFAFNEPHVWTPIQDPLVNCVIQNFILTFVAVLVDRHRSELWALRALLPICAWCRRIRMDAHRWAPIEAYITEQSHIQFTHGLCPDCLQSHSDDSDGRSALVPDQPSF